MRIMIFSLCIISILIYSCGPKKVKYEDATKWYNDCIPHPGAHLGDYYAYIEICTEECKNVVDEDNATSPAKEETPDTPMDIYGVETGDIYAERIRKMTCIYGCFDKIHPMAMHVEGGYYTDGSYYAMCQNPFENIHPTKDKYNKSKWQKDRDECMELTYENEKPSFWSRERTQLFYGKWLNRAIKYYRACLDEKGYY